MTEYDDDVLGRIEADDGAFLTRYRDGRKLFDYPEHDWFAWCPVWSPRCGWLWLRRVRRSYSVMFWPRGIRTVRASYDAHPDRKQSQ